MFGPNPGELLYGALRIEGHAGAGEAMVDRANQMLAYSNLCDDEVKTVNTADDCQEIPTGAIRYYVTRESATRDYQSTIQLFRVITDLSDMMMDHGDPLDL